MIPKYLPIVLLLTLLSIIAYGQKQLSPEQIKTNIENVLFADHQHGGHHHLHLDHETQLLKVETKNNNLQLYFHFNEEIDDLKYDLLLESLLPALEEYGYQQLQLFQQNSEGQFSSLDAEFTKSHFTPKHSIENDDPAKPLKGSKKNDLDKGINPHVGQPTASGSLSGKTVWISPGHGWLWNTNTNDYRTQRGNTNGMVEDFGSIENINQYFIQYLKNAGANVWSVRERDMNTNEVIVDNDDGAPTYTETGTWATSSSTGYNGSTYRFAYHTATITATAIYTPNIPKEGWYWVSAYYRSGSNRPVDTQYKVTHAGGETIVSINQEVHGLTWVYLGQFYFDAGTTGKVELLNQSTDAGSQAVIADAIRFGGGIGQLNDCAYPSTPPTNKARYDECARQYARFQGYTTCESDVVTRPHYAEWELAKGTTTEQNNAVYVSLHSNAFNGSARGTVTYMYNGTATPNSALLRNLLQEEIMSNIHECWDAGWQDRGVNAANFGEVRELSTMPGALVELAFHDNATDANALKDPYFRDLAARAMYKGVVKFFNQTTGSPTTISPRSPDHMTAVNSGSGQITLSWNSPTSCESGIDAPTGYNVYMGTHGYGFADAIPVTGTSYTLTGLNPNTTYYFQVTATNAGGESFPTATVAARTPINSVTCDEVPILIVDGFDRLDRASNVDQYESAALGTVERTFIERMNAYDYMVPHARSISSCNLPFDGASNEAVIAGYVNPSDYEAIDWITGEESTVDRTFDLTEQGIVQAFLTGGGKLIASGAEIGWDIGRSSSANAAVSFYNNYLKATYVGDDGGSYNFTGSGIYAGVAGSFDDGTNCEYNSEFPDRLGATGGSTVVLNYSGGTGDGAAVAYNGADFGVVYFGFPLETVTNAGVRNTLICEALTYLEIIPEIPGCTNTIACNYDVNATCDDNTCILPDGCTNPSACNYDMNAACDDGSCSNADPGTGNTNICNGDTEVWNASTCQYDIDMVQVLGCTISTACNYNPNANCNDGSCSNVDPGTGNTNICNGDTEIWNPSTCQYDIDMVQVLGCMDANACNFNNSANCSDNSCTYAPNAAFSNLSATYCTSDGPVTLVPTTTGGTFSGPGISGNTFDPASVPTFNTPISIQYTVGTPGCENTVTQQTVVNTCTNAGLELNLKVILEGAYETSTGSMRTDLLQQNLLPLTQPYNQAPWNYAGIESVTASSNFPANMVDWILVELRTGTPSASGSKTTTLVETVAGILLDDGNVVDTNGNLLTFNQLSIGVNYHILVRHRNHLDIISNGTVTGAAVMTYDFTNTNNAFGMQQLKLIGSKYAMFAADYTHDAIIQITDYNYWANSPAILYVYEFADGNLDGTVQATDFDMWYPNKAKVAPIEVTLP